MIAFLSTTSGVAGHKDKQFASGNQLNGNHKGFEFTYLQTTTPVPSVNVIASNTPASDFGPAPIPTYAKIQGGVTDTPTPVPGTPTRTPTRTPGANTPTATHVPDGSGDSIPLSAFEVVDAHSSGCVGSYRWCPICANPCGPGP